LRKDKNEEGKAWTGAQEEENTLGAYLKKGGGSGKGILLAPEKKSHGLVLLEKS